MNLDRKDVFVLMFLMMLVLVLTFTNNKGINIYDQANYANNAYNIAVGKFVLTPSAITNRFGLLLPAALSIKVFGFSEYSIVFWNIVSFIALILITLKYVGSNKKLIIATAVLLILNPILLEYSADFLPDMGSTLFSYVAIFLTYFGLNASSSNNKIIYGILAGIALFVAFSIKVSVFYLAPFFLLLFLLSIKHQSIKFWIALALSSAIPLAFTLFAYHLITGDWLYRLHAIENEHNISQHSYYGKSLAVIIKRITIDPIVLLLSNPGYSIITILGLYHLTRVKINIKTKEGYLALFTICTLIVYWFGSTSLQSYNPLPMQERMWIIFIPALTLLSIYTLVNNKEEKQKNKFYLVILAPLIGISAYVTFGTPDLKYLSIAGLIFALMLLSLFKFFRIRTYILPASIVFVFVVIQVNVAIKVRNINYYYFEEKAVFNKYFSSNEKTLVITDKSLEEFNSVYYDFSPNPNTTFIWWNSDKLLQTMKDNYENIYLLQNKTRLVYSLVLLNESSPDILINQIGENTLIYNGRHLSLYKYSNLTQ